MKKIIEFKGYNVMRNMWLVGSYLKMNSRSYIVPDTMPEGRTLEDYEVVPSSVGMFSGITSASDTHIYDGDIIKANTRLYAVVFYEGYFGIVTMKQYGMMKNGARPFLNDYAHLDLLIDAVMSEPVEIVSNVYDYERRNH